MTKQKPHYRRSKKGKKFKAGRGKRKPIKIRKRMGWASGFDTASGPNFIDATWENPDEDVYEKRRVLIDADEFLKRQYDQSHAEEEGYSYDDWLADSSESRLQRIREGLEDDDVNVPVPIEEYDEYGQMKDFQEGRHRGIVSKERGEEIPVIQARKKFVPWDREDGDPYKHRKTRWYHEPEEEELDPQWDMETGRFDEYE